MENRWDRQKDTKQKQGDELAIYSRDRGQQGRYGGLDEGGGSGGGGCKEGLEFQNPCTRLEQLHLTF